MERSEPGVDEPMPVEPSDLTTNFVTLLFWNSAKLPVKEPEPAAKLNFKPSPVKAEVFWVRLIY